MHKLWISYSHSKYRLVGKYTTIAKALLEYERFLTLHMSVGDRLKLSYKRE